MRREEVLNRLHAQIRAGRAVIGAGCGTGITARCADAGGADLIFTYNTARFRMMGRSSLAGLLPYGDANADSLALVADLVPLLPGAAIIVGVCGTDPFRLMLPLLRQLRELGVSGVQNWPSVGIIDGAFRANLEATGIRFEQEVEMVRLAHGLDLFTAPYAFDEQQAGALAQAGADVVIAHLGLTTSGQLGAGVAMTLEAAVPAVQAIHDAAVRARRDVLVLAHGGPIATAADAAYVLARTQGVCGFFGGSAMERIPAETALIAALQAFKEIPVPVPPASGGAAALA